MGRAGEEAGGRMAATVMLVEDERKLRDLVRSYLERAGFTVLSTGSGAEAITMASAATPDLIVLDLGLPDVPGETVDSELRALAPTPIVMLTAKSAEEDRIRGLELGADDYVTKPFSPRELVARLRAVLRRAGAREDEPTIVADGLEIDLAARVVRRDGEEIHLTPIEHDLLRTLVRNRGRLMTHRALLTEVWGLQYADATDVLRTHIANLRRKLEPDDGPPRYIRTDPGVGYRFVA